MPVIRVSDYVIDILKKYAVPFDDTPDTVLRRILEEYENLRDISVSLGPSSKSTSFTKSSYPKANTSNEGGTKMEDFTNRKIGELFRKAVKSDLEKKLGSLIIKNSWFISDSIRVLTLYSNKYKDDDKWFYGITQNYWLNWNENTYLLLIMRDNHNCSYCLLDPEDSKKLILKINPSKDNSKKINVRGPSTGKMYIQEWPDFPFEEKIEDIGNVSI